LRSSYAAARTSDPRRSSRPRLEGRLLWVAARSLSSLVPLTAQVAEWPGYGRAGLMRWSFRAAASSWSWASLTRSSTLARIAPRLGPHGLEQPRACSARVATGHRKSCAGPAHGQRYRRTPRLGWRTARPGRSAGISAPWPSASVWSFVSRCATQQRGRMGLLAIDGRSSLYNRCSVAG